MSGLRFAIPIAGSILLALTACTSGSGPAEGRTGPPPTGGAGGRDAGALEKEGWFGSGGGFHAKLRVDGVERGAGKAVLRVSVTSLESAPKPAAGAFTAPGGSGTGGSAAGASANGGDTPQIPLVDPVGRKLYRPLAATGMPAGYRPGQVTRLALDYPPIPAGVGKVTVITPGTAGEFTGVPVTGTGSAGGPAGAPSTPAPGNPASTNPVGLYDITEGEVKETTSSDVDEKIGLRTDVLFAFNSARLSGKAKGVLDEVAAQIRSKADPRKRPLQFVGHTDSKGSDTYNLKLSRRRAEAVLAEMEKRLGGAFEYTARGRGEAEPVAKEGGSDDAAARSRNRRVEISYEVRQHTEGGTAASTAPAGARGGTVAPAPFRPADGGTVASRFGRFGQDKRRLDVKPFYRDGAYLVAVFDIVNLGPGTTPPDAAYSHRDYPGGVFTAFSVVEPASKDVYRAVRVGAGVAGTPSAYVDSAGAAFRTGTEAPVRGFCYMPAPPGDVRSVVFDGGPFGKVNDVPVT